MYSQKPEDNGHCLQLCINKNKLIWARTLTASQASESFLSWQGVPMATAALKAAVMVQLSRPPTLITALASVAGVAHTGAPHTHTMTPTLQVNTLAAGDVTLCALPPAVTLTAPPSVLAIATAQDRTGS